MTKLPALKAKEAISALEKLGFQMDHVTSRITTQQPILYTHLITLNSFIITGQNNHPLPKRR